MNVLVIGNGAREHAILWKLAQSPRRPTLFAAPGNGGTSQLATNVPVKADDLDGLVDTAKRLTIDLTVVGPEVPLVAGVVDRFRGAGLRVFGPTQAAARIEGSKAFAKQLMHDAGVPTAAFRIFDDAPAARAYVREHGAPVVVKADGIAAGKGVVVASSVEEAEQAIDNMMVRRVFGASGERVVIEDCLTGQEVSVFGFTDGTSVAPLAAACDYKRIFDGDRGPNTGGMGGYSPPPFWTAELEREIQETCMERTVRALSRAGTPFTGVLYGGLMLTEAGPRVIEFNARFGDPETQFLLPRLETDLLDVVDAVIDGKVDRLALAWSSQAAVGVAIASGGYPGEYETGKPITGMADLPAGTLAFHAGTSDANGAVVTGGGRVLTVVGVGDSLGEARQRAYDAAERVRFDGAYYRRDIASFAASATGR